MISSTVNMTEKETVIFIGGMTCQSCVVHIESVLSQKPGVKLVKVSLEQKVAFVRYNPSLTLPTSLASVVDEIGFEASLDSCETLSATWINVSGMTCQSCVRHIEGMVRDVTGVRSVHVSLSDSLVTVIYDSLRTSASSLCGVINEIGFDAELLPNMTGNELNVGNSTAVNSVLLDLGDEFTKLATTRTNAGQQTCEISVEGMTCNSCVKNIESTVSSVSGIISICVSLDQKKAVVVFNPVEISPEAIAAKVDDMGFEAAVLVDQSHTHLDTGKISTWNAKNGKPGDMQHSSRSKKTSFEEHVGAADADAGDNLKRCIIHVTEMTCGSCVANIEKHLRSFKGKYFAASSSQVLIL